MTVLFDEVFTARCIQVVPTQQVGEETVMRFEFLGCGIYTLFPFCLDYAHTCVIVWTEGIAF